MIMFSCRSEDKPSKFIDDSTPKLTMGPGDDAQIGGSTDIIMLVHGFNNEPSRVTEVYAEVKSRLERAIVKTKQFNPIIVGFSWPSNGIVGVLNYYSDICDSYQSGPYLAEALKMCQARGQRLHIVAHSMGGEVTMHALQSGNCPQVDSITIMGGDVPSRWMGQTDKYGKFCRPLNVKRGLVMYSDSDNVVGIAAKLTRPFHRIGAVGLPSDTPANWSDVDAEIIHGDTIHHNSYRQSDKIMKVTMDVIANGAMFQGEK